jgi:hypothetical protein
MLYIFVPGIEVQISVICSHIILEYLERNASYMCLEQFAEKNTWT